MHGYFRMGYGASSEKGRMVCFQVAGAPSKYRLGNECDQYGEFNFSAPMYVGNDGVVASAYFMPAIYIPTSIGHPQGISSPANTTATGADYAFPIWYMDVKGISWLGGGTAWAGRRYYKREDFFLTDFFYWNPSGLGGGIEDIQLGDMKLSYAAFVVDGPATSAGLPAPPLPSRTDFGVRNDIQLRGIPLYPGGELQLGLNIVLDYSDNPATHSGWGATVRHVQELLGGTNKLAIQYGQGGGVGFGIPDSLVLESGVTRLRIVDVLTIQPTTAIGGQAGVIFQHDELDPGSQDWISIGGRVSFAFTEHAKLLLDVGHDSVNPAVGDQRSLTKITFGPAISAGEAFTSRPELRLFYTFATWNDAARIAGIDSGGIYSTTDKTSGSTFGLHAETWF
jgi:maltoporin